MHVVDLSADGTTTGELGGNTGELGGNQPHAPCPCMVQTLKKAGLTSRTACGLSCHRRSFGQLVGAAPDVLVGAVAGRLTVPASAAIAAGRRRRWWCRANAACALAGGRAVTAAVTHHAAVPVTPAAGRPVGAVAARGCACAQPVSATAPACSRHQAVTQHAAAPTHSSAHTLVDSPARLQLRHVAGGPQAWACCVPGLRGAAAVCRRGQPHAPSAIRTASALVRRPSHWYAPL